MQYFIVPRGFYQNELQNTAQLTTPENKNVTTSTLRSSTSSSSENCGQSPCKISLKEFILSKFTNQTCTWRY